MIRRLFLGLLAAISLTTSAAAQGQHGLSAPDPFWFDNSGLAVTYNNTNGATLRPFTYNPAQRNLALIVAGQSNCTNINPTLYTPPSGTVIDQLNIFDGGAYNIAAQMLGSGNNGAGTPGGGPGNVAARLAQLFITNSIFDHVVVASICVGSTTAADWASGKESQRITAAMRRFAARSITPATASWTFAISWWQGENDNFVGTSQASYIASMNTILTSSQAAGFSCATCRFFVNIQTWNAGTVSPAIQAAQAGVVSAKPTLFFTGGNIDTLNASNRLVDNVHLNDAGAAAAALLVYNAMHASGSPF